MKIKEFIITRYGPISYKDRILLHNNNLLWGKNEKGKTLTIDALIKQLFGKNARDFKDINRVEENPEGYIVLQDDTGRLIKLPDEGKFSDFCDLSSIDCRNIFFIRDSDLSIEEGSRFYANLMDRLTGLETERISSIISALREIGKITPTGGFQDKKGDRLKQKIESANNLTEKIEELEFRIKENKMDALEERIVKKKEESIKIAHEINKQENARRRENYERGRQALTDFLSEDRKSKEFEIYNYGDEKLWSENEKQILIMNAEKNQLFQEFNVLQDEFKEIDRNYHEAKNAFNILEERKKKLDDDVKPELKIYQNNIEDITSSRKKYEYLNNNIRILQYIFLLSLIGLIIKSYLIFYILAIISFITLLFVIGFNFSLSKKESQNIRILEKCKLILSKFEISADDIQTIYSKIQNFDENYRIKASELIILGESKNSIGSRISEIKDVRIPGKEEMEGGAKEFINQIKKKSGAESIGEYTKNLRSKEENRTVLESKKSILESLFGSDDENTDICILKWEEKINTLEKYKDENKDIKYDEESYTELDRKKHNIENDIEGLERKIESYHKEMQKIEETANNDILRLEDEFFHCNTLKDLTIIKNKVNDFKNEKEDDKKNIINIIKIFEEIEAEEMKRISELFGKKSVISKLFKEITDGQYTEVIFDQGKGKIIIKSKDGIPLEAGKLKGGAYDQLYLSIRIALGEKLLKGNKGFFIMDDPFVKADPDRLRNQIEILRRIAKSGWQIIYFSAKGEIKDAFKDDIKMNRVNLIEI